MSDDPFQLSMRPIEVMKMLRHGKQESGVELAVAQLGPATDIAEHKAVRVDRSVTVLRPVRRHTISAVR